jgi:glycosyl transferase family 25
MKTNPHIFIINLEKDTKRKAHMEELCQTYSLSCQFIKAIVGKDLSEDYIQTIYCKETAIKMMGRELGHGEIGCSLSHISIYKKIIDEALPYAVVLEDDIDTLQDLQIIIDSHQNFPADWELLLLGEYCDHISLDAQFSSFWRWKSIKNAWKAVRLVRHSAGAHAYIIPSTPNNKYGTLFALKEDG